MSPIIKILIVIGLIVFYITLVAINKKIPKPKCDTKELEDCETCSISCINNKNKEENGEKDKQ